MWRRLGTSWELLTLIVLGVGTGLHAFRGWPASAGFGIGFVVTGVHLVLTYLAIGIAGRWLASKEGAPIGTRAVWLSVGALASLPLVVWIGVTVTALGSEWRLGFLLGMGLVYFALVGWAVAKS